MPFIRSIVSRRFFESFDFPLALENSDSLFSVRSYRIAEKRLESSLGEIAEFDKKTVVAIASILKRVTVINFVNIKEKVLEKNH